MGNFIVNTHTCYVCGMKSSHRHKVQHGPFGHDFDLDGRPPETMRSHLSNWVQTCPYCGYCAQRLEDINESAPRTIMTDKYRRQLDNPEYPELANAFLCYAIILEDDWNEADAAWNQLYAAWVCDDSEGHDLQARICRYHAADSFQFCLRNGPQYAEDPFSMLSILADVHRMSGYFDEAIIHCNRGLEICKEQEWSAVFEFQIHLCQTGDTKCYKRSDALRFKK